MVQNELDALSTAHQNDFLQKGSIFYQRELVTRSLDNRRVDLITITSVDGANQKDREPLLSGLFPDAKRIEDRPPSFSDKEIVFISARVHPGEVPAQHTFKGILTLLMDAEDLRAKELRARYVFKLIPILNPDGVYRGHFRMDQLAQNLNRYYINNDPSLQPSIYAAKTLTDYFAERGRLAVYLDFHAHASKRGCFIYGNVLDSAEDQIQNQLYCKLISMNTPHFDYEGCLFSKEHMTRIDPGDQAKGLTAEGSGRVSMYLAHGLVHSYTIECNYNTSRVGNEVAPFDNDPYGGNANMSGGNGNGSPFPAYSAYSVEPASSPFTVSPDKYTPLMFAGVGRACVLALLDIRGHNPCSRIPKSKYKTIDRVRQTVAAEVRNRKEYLGRPVQRDRRRTLAMSGSSGSQSASVNMDDLCWRRVVDKMLSGNGDGGGTNDNSDAETEAAGSFVSSRASEKCPPVNGGQCRGGEAFVISMSEKGRRRTKTSSVAGSAGGVESSSKPNTATTSTRPSASRLTSLPPMIPAVTQNQTHGTPSREVSSCSSVRVPLPPAANSSSSGSRSHPQQPPQQPIPPSADMQSTRHPNALRPHLAKRTTNTSGGGTGTPKNGLTETPPRSRATDLLGDALSGFSLSSATSSASNSSTTLQHQQGPSVDAATPQLSLTAHGFSHSDSAGKFRAINNSASGASVNGSDASAHSHHHHHPRNILGKKLHAAGVALLMGEDPYRPQTTPVRSKPDIGGDGGGSSASPSARASPSIGIAARGGGRATPPLPLELTRSPSAVISVGEKLRMMIHPNSSPPGGDGIRGGGGTPKVSPSQLTNSKSAFVDPPIRSPNGAKTLRFPQDEHSQLDN